MKSPEYSDPPLDEVVVGVQFSGLRNYTSLVAARVHDLFRAEYPEANELPRLPPVFEMFGAVNTAPGLNIQFGPTVLSNRLWFVSKDKQKLLQFQSDKFLFNWRRLKKDSQSYPRFSTIFDEFKRCWGILETFSQGHLQSDLLINQAEVSYINVFTAESVSTAVSYIKNLTVEGDPPDAFNVQLTNIVTENNRPKARFSRQFASGRAPTAHGNIFKLEFTYRGNPKGTKFEDAERLIRDGHDRIVNSFDQSLTSDGKNKWGRVE